MVLGLNLASDGCCSEDLLQLTVETNCNRILLPSAHAFMPEHPAIISQLLTRHDAHLWTGFKVNIECRISVEDISGAIRVFDLRRQSALHIIAELSRAKSPVSTGKYPFGPA